MLLPHQIGAVAPQQSLCLASKQRRSVGGAGQPGQQHTSGVGQPGWG